MTDNKTKCLMKSHIIIGYAKGIKRDADHIQHKMRRTKDLGEKQMLRLELEVLEGVMDKLGEMEHEIEEKLYYRVV